MESKPLLNRQKEDIYKLWCDIHGEDDINRKELLFDFCNENKCDIVIAINYLISKIRDTVFILNKGIAGYLLDDDNPVFGLKIQLDMHVFGLNEEENPYQEFLAKVKNGDGHYVNNNPYSSLSILSTEIVKEDIELLKQWEKEFEEEIDKQKLLKSKGIDSKEIESIFKTKYSRAELRTIFKESKELGLFDNRTPEKNFLYVFTCNDKPNDFKKLVWIYLDKSKQPNKKALIYFCMLMFDLKPEHVLQPFFNFINERIITNEIDIGFTNKPDINYSDEKIKNIFPN